MMNEQSHLPKNWVVTSLQSIAEINPTLNKSAFEDNLEVSFVPMPSVEAETGKIDISPIKKFGEVKKGYTPFQEKDILFAKITPCMENGKMAVVPKLHNNIGFGSTEFHVLRAHDGIEPKFLYYYISSKSFRYDAEHNMTGAVGQKRVPTGYIKECKILLPPTQEQKRIVAKIEELFSKLDKGIENLKTAREQLKVYRQSVLKNAFEGKLTEKWREENKDKLESADELLKCIQKKRDRHYQRQLKDWQDEIKIWELNGKKDRKPVKPRKFNTPEDLSNDDIKKLSPLPKGWKWYKVGDLFGVYVGSTPSRKKSCFWNGSIPWVSSGEVSFCHINSTTEKITREGFDNASTDIHPVGTVMLAMIGEGKTRGQAAILNIEAAHNQNTAAIRVSETECSPMLFYYYLLYRYELTRRLGSGNNQKALNKDRVSNILFPLMSILEQDQITCEISNRISVIENLEQTINIELQKSESLRQSILKKAFSGELVKQDTNDEPASVLLDRISKEKEIYKPKQKKTKSKRKVA